MIIELQAMHLILKMHKQNPYITKREIGVWSSWKEDIPENNKPLSEREIERYKSYLKKHAPSNFNEPHHE